jgi:ABC-type dipeptide/oligopeptide/nickel transport system ATPase component
MPNGCRFKARCEYATAGCDAEQELLDAGAASVFESPAELLEQIDRTPLG